MSKSRLITVVALSLMALQASAADKSLVLYLPFDEGAGTTTKDLSSYNNPGTIVGNAAWVAGPKGTALEFVAGSRVTIPEIPEYDVTAEVSLLAWVKATTVPNWARVIDKSQWQTSGFDLVLTQNVGLPRLEFFVNNTTSLVDGTTVVVDGEWHFIVGTFGNKTLRMYVDGQRQGEAQSAGGVDINPNDLSVMIAGESSSNGGNQFFGSVDEAAMYNRELSADEVLAIFQSGMALPDLAAYPQPQNEAVDVPRDAVLGWTPGGFAASHDVYFGASLDDVSSADRDNPMGALVSEGQSDATYDPAGLLEYGQTYYWRIDEVNAAPDFTIFKGKVWSFTAEPYGYPIPGIIATASSSAKNMGPEKTVDGSGLDPDDGHSTKDVDMWMTSKGMPAWIQYDFNGVYTLHEMQVWNANQSFESNLGFGARDVKVEYSLDGAAWTQLENVPQFAQGISADQYAANTTVAFGGVSARYVKLTMTSNWGSIPQVSLSEVRFLYVPVQAFEPQPETGATAVGIDTELDWRPGRMATSHVVYLGTDSNAVAEGLVSGHTVADHGYAPTLNLGTTYYWKVDEVGDGGTDAGEVWSFTTEDYASIDDFESYTDEDGFSVFDTWVDGVTTEDNGSTIGYLTAPFSESAIVHSGEQSTPFSYDNVTWSFSEAEMPFDPPQDWTGHGITTLVLYFRGQITNSPASLYVKINGTKVSFNNGAAATTMPLWKQWAIPLASTGVNLKSVKSLVIGISGGSTGQIFIDDIRLYAAAPAVASPIDPAKSGLVALYTMDGNTQDTSGKNYHGTINGTTSFEPGYAGEALVFNGTNAYVDLPIGPLVATLTDTTIAAHVYFAGSNGAWQRVFDFGSASGASPYMFLCPRENTSGPVRFAIRTSTVAEQIITSPGPISVGWHHMAVTINSAAMRVNLYLDGVQVGSGATTVLPKDLGNTTQNWLGRSQYATDGYFAGSIDDFRIYNRVLSEAELRYLAGDR